MKKAVRLIAIVLAISLCSGALAVSASAAGKYDPNAALTYAKAHWKDKDGSLCAEFVSDCLKAGGCGAYSESCTTLLNQLESGRYGRLTQLTMSDDGRLPAPENSGKVSPGDPIFWYCPNHDRPYVHVVLCGGTSGKYVTAYAHNAPKNNEVVTANKCGYCGGKIQAVYAFQMSGRALSGKPDEGIKTGVWCNLINVGSGKYLNVYGSSAKNSANIDVYERDGTSGEKFMFTYTSSGWYTITPACAVSRRVNVYGTRAKQGANVCTWTSSGHSTQGWIIERVSGGYIIRSADNTSLVLTATGNKNSSNVKLVKYTAGDKYQIWKIG